MSQGSDVNDFKKNKFFFAFCKSRARKRNGMLLSVLNYFQLWKKYIIFIWLDIRFVRSIPSFPSVDDMPYRFITFSFLFHFHIVYYVCGVVSRKRVIWIAVHKNAYQTWFHFHAIQLHKWFIMCVQFQFSTGWSNWSSDIRFMLCTTQPNWNSLFWTTLLGWRESNGIYLHRMCFLLFTFLLLLSRNMPIWISCFFFSNE